MAEPHSSEELRQWRRLSRAVHPSEATHPIDAGALGEYAAFLYHQGELEARQAFPEVADHLAAGCIECGADIEELAAFFLEEHRNTELGEARRWLPAIPFVAWSYAGGYAPPEDERASGPRRAAPLPAVALFEIAEYPELIMEAAPEMAGTRIKLSVRVGAPAPIESLAGWDVRVLLGSGARTHEGATDTEGAVHLAGLSMDSLALGRVQVRLPAVR